MLVAHHTVQRLRILLYLHQGHEVEISSSISNSSSCTLVSGRPEQKDHGPAIANGSYPYGGYGTLQNGCRLKDETSPSGEQSTPSPVAVRSAQEAETPTRSASNVSFQSIIPEAVPKTPKPADPANLFVKNFDDDLISDPDDLKTLLSPTALLPRLIFP